MLQGIGAITGALTVMLAAVIGANTFEKWRRQKISERRIEQAERFLTAAYNARRALARVRSPAMMGYELEIAEERLREAGRFEPPLDAAKTRRLCTAQAYHERLNREREVRVTLDECLPTARALFSEALEKALETLSRQFHTVQVYADASVRYTEGRDRALSDKIDQTIWSEYPSAAENEMDKTIAEQIGIIETALLPVLRLEAPRPRRWWSPLARRSIPRSNASDARA
ncbi:hypothetical protein V7S57_12000 [Caulobacter sp. CCNWLY153]|uniref:Uncharacterized protein n=1 Tax=Caulobacter radicis TaxID=2172650 RepID=A0A2T9JIL2_9CAUL|nr:hypothetical protein [Caulobacter radicis]PVM79409.1 hypothetical protein DDF65_15020 [Caulobacter radicis]PVM83532.1 hypothetical protein DDF62_24820 [Caulobacter radicis]